MPDLYGMPWEGAYPADLLARRVAELWGQVHALQEASKLVGETYRAGVRLRVDDAENTLLAQRNRIDALEARLAQIENSVTILRSEVSHD